MYELVLDHFRSIFVGDNITLDNGLVEEVIPKVVDDTFNCLLTKHPSTAEIHNVFLSMNKEGGFIWI